MIYRALLRRRPLYRQTMTEKLFRDDDFLFSKKEVAADSAVVILRAVLVFVYKATGNIIQSDRYFFDLIIHHHFFHVIHGAEYL